MDQSGSVEVNGARFHYETRGTGHPLVLAHAGICDCRMWDDQMDAFARQYQVIRYDHRGFGRSEMPPGPYTPHEDLYGLLQSLGVERAHLIGASMSGAMAIDFTLAHPEVVTALIPVGAGLSGFDASDGPEAEQLFEQVEAAIKEGDLERANDLEVHIWVDGVRRTPDQVNASVRERVREMNGLSFARLAEQEQAQRQGLEPPASGRLSEIHAPTLVIYGDEDLPAVPVVADKLAAEIPGARKVVMHGTAHVPNMEQPEEFNRIVLEFLGSLS